MEFEMSEAMSLEREIMEKAQKLAALRRAEAPVKHMAPDASDHGEPGRRRVLGRALPVWRI
mgnify:CR=1 FL=1